MGSVLSRNIDPSEDEVPGGGDVSAREEETCPEEVRKRDGKDDAEEEEARKRELEAELVRFKEEMARKRAARREAIEAVRAELAKERAERQRLESLLVTESWGSKEIGALKEELSREKAEKQGLEELLKDHRSATDRRVGALETALEGERTERLRLEALLEEGGSKALVEGLERQVKALKDVSLIGGEMLRIRELQVNELKSKLEAIEETGIAYEKEVENMRRLRQLYDERTRAMAISHQMEVEREKARVVAAETRLEISEEKNRELSDANQELEKRIASLDSTIDKNSNEISELKVQLAGKNEELFNANSQITIVNNLFSQVLTEPENLERVTRVLEEHHDLMNHLTCKGNINDVASVLMRVADKDRVLSDEEKDIATNLSKVWKLLVELLGLHTKQPQEAVPDSCYKSIDTPTGPKLVISVSQTFLRLKDLILEKNSLVKEVSRLKDLNTHLEERLISQEQRLVEVAEELHKTWGVVNKLKTQHKAIHTHEQVLRYELKHKRLMLNELKQQLEECREMWQMARIKNTQTEKDWEILRKEFAERKQQISSAESGYEESPGDSQDEEDSHKMVSDDESESQEVATSGPRLRRIRRLLDSEVSTPDRSTTPDIPGAELDDTEISEMSNPNEKNTADDGTTDAYEYCVPLDQTVQILPWNEFPEEITRDSSILPTIHEIHNEENFDCTEAEPEVTFSTASIVRSEQDSSPGPSNPSVSPTEEGLARPTVGEIEHEENFENTETELQVASTSHSNFPSQVESSPGPSNSPMSPAEEALARREARLKRLEEQCKNLFTKVSDTNKRSDMISNKLVELHEQYGEDKNEPSTSETSSAAQPVDHTSNRTPESQEEESALENPQE